MRTSCASVFVRCAFVVMVLLLPFASANASSPVQAFTPAAEKEPVAAQAPQPAPGEKTTAAPAQEPAPSQAAPQAQSGASAPAAEKAAEAAPQEPVATTTARKPVRIEEKSLLPLRVLTRSMSSLYKEPDEQSGVVQGNLPAFLPYYVYTRPGGEDRSAGKGWYEVGTDNRGTIAGWLKTDDVFEWKQTMCLTYTHPENRQPVLMFDAKETLLGLIGKDAATRAQETKALHTTIASGSIPKDFSVVSVEPQMAVDFSKQFYLLPILNHEVISLDGREGRVLELAAVSGASASAREKTDIRENKKYAEGATVSSSNAAGAVEKQLKFDIVWVVDTTRSMGPYLDATRDVIKNVSSTLAADKAVSDQIHFGVWGYRDPVEAIPDIEYTTKNFTPSLQGVEEFVGTMSQVKETKVDSVDFPEDVFSGLSDAITKTQWTPGAIRFLVLMGDAPGHELGHKFNTSGYDEPTVLTLAKENNVSILAIQVRPQGAVKFQKLAEKQFTALSLGVGATTAAYYSIIGSEMPSFTTATNNIVKALSAVTVAAQGNNLGKVVALATEEAGGEMAALADKSEAPVKLSPEASAAIKEGNTGVNQAIKAAVVQWIGRAAEAQAPRDVVAWVVDKDLVDTSRQSLEVRLLINKSQLDSLAVLLADIIKAGRKGQISGDDFFTSLQAASAVASRDPNMLKNAKSLAQSGLVPDFLSGLPYHSRLMDMSNELWNSWSPDEQDNFLNELDARTKAYKALHDNPQGWITLNEGADADEAVYPIPLELLP